MNYQSMIDGAVAIKDLTRESMLEHGEEYKTVEEIESSPMFRQLNLLLKYLEIMKDKSDFFQQTDQIKYAIEVTEQAARRIKEVTNDEIEDQDIEQLELLRTSGTDFFKNIQKLKARYKKAEFANQDGFVNDYLFKTLSENEKQDGTFTQLDSNIFRFYVKDKKQQGYTTMVVASPRWFIEHGFDKNTVMFNFDDKITMDTPIGMNAMARKTKGEIKSVRVEFISMADFNAYLDTPDNRIYSGVNGDYHQFKSYASEYLNNKEWSE